MALFGVIFFVCLLALPSVLCCFMGGWFFLLGIVALGCWLCLLLLVGKEFWQWYKNPDANHWDNP